MTAEELSILYDAFTRIHTSQMDKAEHPVKDELSRNQAEKEFGKRWLAFQIEKGTAKGIRRGAGKTSKIIFSRHELNIIKQAERTIAIVNK